MGSHLAVPLLLACVLATGAAAGTTKSEAARKARPAPYVVVAKPSS